MESSRGVQIGYWRGLDFRQDAKRQFAAMARIVTVAVRVGKLAHEQVATAHVRVTVAEGSALRVNEPGRPGFRPTTVIRPSQARAGRGNTYENLPGPACRIGTGNIQTHFEYTHTLLTRATERRAGQAYKSSHILPRQLAMISLLTRW